ncbi:MAG: branched-chain amino acid ABC transporter permease [Myxococcales bacterium]|nr:branched-chain amino acid ABC transporter permease [Myxococcales bacterium]
MGYLRAVSPFLGAIVLAFVMQFGVAPMFGAYYQKLLIDIGINIVLAVSLNLVNGFAGQFSIGHAAFMAVGGYAAGAITYYGSFHVFGDALVHHGQGDVLFLAATLVGGCVAAVAGWVVGLPSLRLKGDYLAIVTLGFGEIVRVLLQLTDDVMFKRADIEAASVGTLALALGGALGFGGLPFYTSIVWTYFFAFTLLVIAVRLKTSGEGRAFLSVRENEIAASAMGIDTTRYKVRAFVLAAFFAGIAGSLFAHEIGTTLNPRELGFQKSFDIVIMVVLGGMGSISGAVLAAIVLTLLPEFLREAASYRMIIYALLLISMMILRPQGLFGVREVWELYRRPKVSRPQVRPPGSLP